MNTYTLDEFAQLSPTPDPPAPVPTTPVRPCFRVRDFGLERSRPGPTMWCDLSDLQAVAGAFDAAKGGPLTPDELVAAAAVEPHAADVALSFLLFTSAVVRAETDLYCSNTPCVEARPSPATACSGASRAPTTRRTRGRHRRTPGPCPGLDAGTPSTAHPPPARAGVFLERDSP